MRKTCMLALLLGIGATGCMLQRLPQADAKAAGDALGNGVEDSAATYGPMVSTAADAACITLTGDSSDPDNDMIPNSATLTYACTSQALGLTGMLTGTQMIVDDQPSTLAWAFTGTADMHASLTGAGGASITSDWTGDLVGSQTTALGPFALDRRLDVTTVFQSAGDARPRTTTVTEQNAWTVTFTPLHTWTPGGIIVTGSLTAFGSWNVTVGANAFDATLSTSGGPFSTSGGPLTITPTCQTLVTAGAVTGSYANDGGGTGYITVTWTGCGQRTVTHTECNSAGTCE